MAALVTANEVQGFMSDMPPDEATAAAAADTATALIEGYTRGNHIDPEGEPRPGIHAVALTIASRLAANPGQVNYRVQAGAFNKSVGNGFNGFTLAETAVLNRYRKRAIG